MSDVAVPAHPAILYALALALEDPSCMNPDALMQEGILVLQDGNRAAGEIEAMGAAGQVDGLGAAYFGVTFLDAAATFLRAGALHYPSSILEGAADVVDQMREDILSGALNPVPGSPSLLS